MPLKCSKQLKKGDKVPHAERRHSGIHHVELYLNSINGTLSHLIGKSVVYSVAGIELHYLTTHLKGTLKETLGGMKIE